MNDISEHSWLPFADFIRIIGQTPRGIRRLMPFLLLTLLAFVVRLFQLGVKCFWFDEAYTWFITRLPMAEALQALVADGVHPPLFYFIQKIIQVLGESEGIFRLASLLFGTLAAPLFYIMAEQWINRRVAIFGGLLVVFSPFHVWYSQEARMYALLMLLSIACMLAYERIFRDTDLKWAVIFIVVSALSYMTHYFALFLPLVQFVHLVRYLWSNPRVLRKWTLYQFIASIPLILWVIQLALRDQQIFGIGWVPKPQWSDLFFTLINLTIGYTHPLSWLHWIGLAVAILLIGLGLRTVWAWSEARLLTIIWAILPVLISFLLSFEQPIYMDRFFIISLPALLLLMASGIAILTSRSALALNLATVLLFLIGTVRFNFYPGQQKEDWCGLATYLDQVQPEETIVVRVVQMVVPLRFYSDNSIPLKVMEVNREITPISELALGYQGLWLLYWNATNDAHLVSSDAEFDPLSEGDQIAKKWVTGQGPTILEKKDFIGLTAFHFDLPP